MILLIIQFADFGLSFINHDVVHLASVLKIHLISPLEDYTSVIQENLESNQSFVEETTLYSVFCQDRGQDYH